MVCLFQIIESLIPITYTCEFEEVNISSCRELNHAEFLGRLCGSSHHILLCGWLATWTWFSSLKVKIKTCYTQYYR